MDSTNKRTNVDITNSKESPKKKKISQRTNTENSEANDIIGSESIREINSEDRVKQKNVDSHNTDEASANQADIENSEANDTTENKRLEEIDSEDKCNAENESSNNVDESIIEDTSEQPDEPSDSRKGHYDLSEEQKKVIEYVNRLIEDDQFRKKNPTVILVEGPAGTGKTQLLIELSLDQKAVSTASFGVAALNYQSGSTAHSMFGFSIFPNIEVPSCNISDDKTDEITTSKIIVFDDVQSMHIDHIKELDKQLKELMSSEESFGGKIIVFAADFRSIIPVVSNEKSPALFSPRKFFQEISIKKFELTFPYRMKTDKGYLTFMKRLACKTNLVFSFNMNADENDKKKFSVMLYNIGFRNNISDLIAFVFPEYILSNPENCIRRAILAPKNEEVDEINKEILNIISKNARTTPFKSSIITTSITTGELLHEKELNLIKGCLCMVIHNIYEPVKLFNGTKVVVVETSSDIIWVRKLGEHTTIPIKKIPLLNYEKHPLTEKDIKVERTQFPLKLCYARTIHKSLGLTFDRVGIDLRQGVFKHGQLYLALSRVRHRQDMMVCIKECQFFQNVARVKNVVEEALAEDPESLFESTEY